MPTRLLLPYLWQDKQGQSGCCRCRGHWQTTCAGTVRLAHGFWHSVTTCLSHRSHYAFSAWTVLANVSQHRQSLSPLPPWAFLQHLLFLAASPQSLPCMKWHSCASHPVLGLDMVFEVHFSWGENKSPCRDWAVHWHGRQGISAGKSFFRLLNLSISGNSSLWEQTLPILAEKKSAETLRVKILLCSY